MLDHLIKGATVVDGTGSPAQRADIGIVDGKIAEVGRVSDTAHNVLDADGLVVTPGFVDPHTHYDAQLLWDPCASPSNVHGVTTIIAGNCGFTLAPLKPEDADYIRRMMAKVEGMPLAALEEGVDWNWETFAEYLGRLTGHVAVNTGFLVGHCALRRYVMGPAATGHEASAEQIAAMVDLLHRCLDAGGLGFSTTFSQTHSDGDGQPVASRFASRDELLALCRAVGEHEGTTLEGIVNGCLDMFSDEEIELLVAMTTAAGRPLNWNVLTIDSRKPERVARQLEPSKRAEQAGGRIVALTMPVLVPMNMSFLNYCALNMLPGWGPVLGLPVPERIEKLRDPAVRMHLLERAESDDAGVFRRLADFANYVIGDTYAPENQGFRYRTVRDIAAEQGKAPFDALCDIVIADELRTVLWPIPPDNDDESWAMRQAAWNDEHVMLGGSDAGAHLDRMMGASYTTRFLGDCLRGRRLVSLERAVQMLTDEPARLFGLRGRGRIASGFQADLVVFDPDQIGAENATLVHDLPGGSARLISEARGVVRVFVNGVVTVVDNRATDELPGTVLRSGVDTYSVATR
ncbi:MAG: amidohydrolase family protein [Acidimicrobiales bacterium]|nr:amidohydrolase family protein [Acidimicrobiales bacterium]